MRRFVLSLLIPLALAAMLVAQTKSRTYQRLDVTDGPVAIASATLDPPGQLQIQTCEARLETAQIRMADLRAVTVSSATGRIVEIGDVLTFATHGDATNARFAKTGSTTGVLMIECGQP